MCTKPKRAERAIGLRNAHELPKDRQAIRAHKGVRIQGLVVMNRKPHGDRPSTRRSTPLKNPIEMGKGRPRLAVTHGDPPEHVG